ncbi:MAG: TonB-dependent receptor, partial [Bacteroidales bacterium]|nr:TonB-dependent receptor [Bacteroidales bacterium]
MSLKLLIQVFVIVFIILLFNAKSSFCQNDTSLQQNLFEMSFDELMNVRVIGVSKKKESLQETPMSVYVVGNKELQNWGARSLYEVLGRVPGFSFYHTDFYGQFGVVGRGMSSVWRYSMGFELLQIEDFGHFIYTPHFFKNVEVARGPAGLMWGDNAEAGLINFNLRDDLDGFEVHSSAGNYNRFSTDILYGKEFNGDGDGLFLGFHYVKQNYEEIANELGIFPDNVIPHVRLNGINPSWSVIGKYKDGGFKAIVFQEFSDHIIPHPWNWNDSLSIELINELEKENGILNDRMETSALRAEYDFFWKRDDLDLVLYSSYYSRRWFITGLGSLTQRKYTHGFRFKKIFWKNRFLLHAGGDLYCRDISDDPSFNSYIATQHGFNWYDDKYYSSTNDFSNIYAQIDMRILPKLKMVVGSRLDYQKDAPRNDAIFSGPRLGLIFMPNEYLTLKALYNKTDRRPSGNEISEGQRQALPENLDVMEGVVMFRVEDKLSVDLTIFHQQLKNRIFKIDAGEHLGFTNGGGIKSSGIETNMVYSPISKIKFYTNAHYHFVRSYEKSIDSIAYSVASFQDNRIPFTPAFSSFSGWEYYAFNSLSISLSNRLILSIPYFGHSNEELST